MVTLNIAQLKSTFRQLSGSFENSKIAEKKNSNTEARLFFLLSFTNQPQFHFYFLLFTTFEPVVESLSVKCQNLQSY